MADVRGLVGIDAGVFDNCMEQAFGRDLWRGGCHQSRGGSTIQIRIDISGAGNLKTGKTFDRTERSNDFLRDDFGRLAQSARELQGDGRGDFAEMQIRRRLQRDVRDVEREFFVQGGTKSIGEPFFQFQNHARASQIPDYQGDFIILIA